MFDEFFKIESKSKEDFEEEVRQAIIKTYYGGSTDIDLDEFVQDISEYREHVYETELKSIEYHFTELLDWYDTLVSCVDRELSLQQIKLNYGSIIYEVIKKTIHRDFQIELSTSMSLIVW